MKIKSHSKLKSKIITKLPRLKPRNTMDGIENNTFLSYDNFLDKWIDYIYDRDSYDDWASSMLASWSEEDIEEKIINHLPIAERSERLEKIHSLGGKPMYYQLVIEAILDLSEIWQDKIHQQFADQWKLEEDYDDLIFKLEKKVDDDQKRLQKKFPTIKHPIEIYRAVRKDSVEDIEFGKSKHRYWSWDKDSAQPYSGVLKGTNEYILTAIVSRDDINWEHTILSGTHPFLHEEEEIFPDLNKPILVTNIELKKGKTYVPISHPFQLPLETD